MPLPDPEKLKSMPWYHPTIASIGPPMRILLEERGIPPDQVLSHVQTIRDQAWLVHPYPCIGMFSFTHLLMQSHPSYRLILSTLQNPKSQLLDLGCGLAQDLRSLVSSGIPGTGLTALDSTPSFFELGHHLSLDSTTLGARFIQADMLDLSTIPTQLIRTFDVIWAGASFHLFDWDGQVKACKVAVELLKDSPGVMVVGYQAGHVTGHEIVNPNVESGKMWLHDEESFRRMWGEVAGEWTIRTWVEEAGVEHLRGDPAVRRLSFEAVRVEGEGKEKMKVIL